MREFWISKDGIQISTPRTYIELNSSTASAIITDPNDTPRWYICRSKDYDHTLKTMTNVGAAQKDLEFNFTFEPDCGALGWLDARLN